MSNDSWRGVPMANTSLPTAGWKPRAKANADAGRIVSRNLMTAVSQAAYYPDNVSEHFSAIGKPDLDETGLAHHVLICEDMTAVAGYVGKPLPCPDLQGRLQ